MVELEVWNLGRTTYEAWWRRAATAAAFLGIATVGVGVESRPAPGAPGRTVPPPRVTRPPLPAATVPAARAAAAPEIDRRANATAAPARRPPVSAAPVETEASLAAPASPLARAIMAARPSGRPVGERAAALVSSVERHCDGLDHYTVAALMWVESGFRPDAVSKNHDGTRNLGILQLHERYVPRGVNALDPHAAIREGCHKLRKWIARCTSKCKRAHDPLMHWFGGERPGGSSGASARKVRTRAEILRSLAREGLAALDEPRR